MAHFGERRRTRYPRALRLDATEYLRRRLAQGADITAVACELGVERDTLRRWSEAMSAPGLGDGAEGMNLVPVVVRAEPHRGTSGASTGIVLHGPGGMRVEGLTVTQLAELMGALGC